MLCYISAHLNSSVWSILETPGKSSYNTPPLEGIFSLHLPCGSHNNLEDVDYGASWAFLVSVSLIPDKNIKIAANIGTKQIP